MDNDLLTAEESGALAGRSASTIWRWHAHGHLEAVTVAGRTRFQRADVLRLLEPRRKASPSEAKGRRRAG